MKNIHLFIGILFCIITIGTSCNSQGNTNNVQVLAKQEANNKIELDPNATVIYLDKYENLWLASKEKGVYKYDGKNLVLFNSKDGLTTNHIINVQEDKSANLYFDTPNAVFRYNGGKFISLPIVKNTGAENQWKSEPGDLWFRIGWDQKGPFRFDGKDLYQLTFPKTKLVDEFYGKAPNTTLNPYAIYSIYKDSKGYMWFGTAYLGIYLFDGSDISWMYEPHLTEFPGGGDFGIRSVGEDKDGNYWICNPNYKYTLLPNDDVSEGAKPINYRRQVGIENMEEKGLYFYNIEKTNNGDLLMNAQEDGIWLNDGKKMTQFFINDNGQNLSPTSMYKDYQGTFWFGTDKQGVYKFDEKSFERFEIK